MDFKELLGDEYDENMTVTQLNEKLNEKNVNLVNWDDNKHIMKRDYIDIEHKLIDKKEKLRATTKELEELKKSTLSEEELRNQERENEKQELMNRIKALETEKNKSEMLAMYTSIGYSSDIAKSLVDMDYYDGEDKISKKQELLKAANESLMSDYKRNVMNSDTTPKQSSNGNVSKSDFWKNEYQKALSSSEPYKAASVIRKAMEDGVDINNL